MQIEEGKYYRTHSGKKVGPALRKSSQDWVLQLGGGRTWGYTENGNWGQVSGIARSNGSNVRDLVEEWKDEPVSKIDLSKNTTPWGLLDEDVRKAFLNHVIDEGGIEFWCDGVWVKVTNPQWINNFVYRTVPKPVIETRSVRIVDNSEGWFVSDANLDFKDDKPMWETLRVANE